MNADELAGLVRDDIAAALLQPDHSLRMTELRAAAEVIFRLAYEDVPGDPVGIDQATMHFLNTLTGASAQTQPDGTPEQADRIADIWGVAAANAAVHYSDPGAARTWITMQDDAVRDLHVPLHGVTAAAGQPFNVGGFHLMYPGQPKGPPHVWIGCRCRLEHAVTASAEEPLTARAYSTEKRKEMADKSQAMSDGSFPIADEHDLRNAIQAIGRAKDPEAARRHIRKRAKALGLTDLLPDSWTASAVTAAPGTHDGPGWVTNPKETQRLRDYWAKGEGAAKIGWGSPGDLTRCAKYISKYVGPGYAWGTCQNLHKEALGYWNPESGHKAAAVGDECVGCEGFDPENMTPEGAAVTAAFAAVAELDDARPPREWFTDPHLEGPTALTATDDGEVIGHIGRWDQCHTGYGEDVCVPPPHSTPDYPHFRTGYVATAGGDVAVGNLTLGTGHAPDGVSAASAVSHYDNTGTAVADVAAGEDQFGIWVHGMIRPGATPEQVHALRAGTVSGDWRSLGGQLELVAALVVNVPGFPIPRPAETLAASGRPLSLVAAGVVTVDPNALDAERVAVAVMAQMDQRAATIARITRANALKSTINGLRRESLLAAAEG